jgi:hypothetical protein
MGNIAATKTSLRLNRYIGSIIVAWGRRISVCVHIWGRFRYVKCADFTYVVFTSLYSHNNSDSAAADLRNGFSTKFWVRWDEGVVVIVYLWLIMPCDASWWRCFCEVWVAIFWDRLVLPIDADATDLTPLISRLMVGISQTHAAYVFQTN